MTITKNTVSADGLLAEVPVGWIVSEVLAEKTAGATANTLMIRRGSISGTAISNDLVVEALSGTVEDNLYSAVLTRKRQSLTSNQNIYVSGISSATYNFTIRLERV